VSVSADVDAHSNEAKADSVGLTLYSLGSTLVLHCTVLVLHRTIYVLHRNVLHRKVAREHSTGRIPTVLPSFAEECSSRNWSLTSHH